TAIAFIVRPPARRGVAPHSYDDLFSGVDLTPTILDLLSVPTPADVDGESHAEQLLAEHEVPARTEVFTE
ncbi:sulfatase, partial [Streptomyces sp. SID10244]|nr:sulfatase [Streptomyces sp. SID10244]